MTLDRRQLAVKTAKLRSKSKVPTSDTGHCLREVRECLAVASQAQWAAQAWEQAKFKHFAPNDSKTLSAFLKSIPRGVPIFWRGGALVKINGKWVRPGHVALSTGWASNCFSTDILRGGYFDKVPITLIHSKWGHEFLGWTEDLNGVKVYP